MNVRACAAPLITPDGRYIVVRGRLWRAPNPGLDPEVRQHLIQELMAARRLVRQARGTGDLAAVAEARIGVDAVKASLGEGGSVWWSDGAPDLNRHMVGSTSYADWLASVDIG